MDYNKGISIPAPLALLGNFPDTTRETVENVEERNNMPIGIRFEGMEVYVKNIQTYYRLIGGLDNSKWVSFNPSVNNVLMQNLLDITKELSYEFNKPLKISNIIMLDLNNSSEVNTNMKIVDGLIFI